ncbi:MAG: shikimate dehydrogenase [Bacteroidetes bacterium HGW-Bacteroidetes-6]|jgi:shikimate dehydrogenase|nr:MAG: shikimate dehydrogenase [Bacteroidetes bacterium HGW-Bacteroidetes-6]
MRNFGIIGKPVAHSLSGYWFSSFFAENSIDAQFQMFEPSAIEMQNFGEWIHSKQLNGLLVTIPFKKEVLPFLTETDIHAHEIGAVNVIDISTSNRLTKGYNIDWLAFESEILKHRPNGYKKAVLLGNGGAAAAVAYALQRNGVSLVKVSRNATENCVSYEELPAEELQNADLIINATSLGMKPMENDCPPIDYQLLNPNAFAYDLIYNPAETLFLKKCSAAGCQTENGKGMVEFVYRRAVDLWNI